MSDYQGGRPSKTRTALAVLCTVLAIILAVLLTGTVFASRLLNRVNRVDGSEETLSQAELDEYLQSDSETEPVNPDAPTVDAEDVEWDEADTLVGDSDNTVNILLIGQDRRGSKGRARSDTMVLCTFNKEKKTLTMTSFLRDLYVQIPGYSDNKLNAAYPAGGMALLNETLEKNFGVHVDGDVEVDFAGFTKIIDLLGGVEIDLRADEAAVINRSVEGSQLSAGKQMLNGEQATLFSRIRSLDSDADFSRTNRQRKVLNALINKFKTADLGTILKLLDEILPMVTTNMSNAELIGYATELFPMLAGAEIISQRVPADGTYTCPYIRGMSVVLADMDAARKFLKDTIGD